MELDSNLDPVPHCTVPMWIRSIVFVFLAPALIVQNKKIFAKVSICQKSKLVKIELCTRKYVANLISQFFTICKENVGQKWALSLQKFRLRSKKLGAGRLRFRNHLLACRWQGCGSGPCMTRSVSDLGK